MTKIFLKPLGNKVLVKRVEKEKKSKGGIIIPDSAQEKTQIAEVIAVGPGITKNEKTIPVSVKPKQKILFGKYMGTPIKLNNEELLILKESEILGTIE